MIWPLILFNIILGNINSHNLDITSLEYDIILKDKVVIFVDFISIILPIQ